jgi:hypothetical protein
MKELKQKQEEGHVELQKEIEIQEEGHAELQDGKAMLEWPGC